ncbi:MAG: gamma-glutamyl-gamma-aminobutyrate hydrolase family protein [Solirubrobacterales bacterium]|nr:gamma-glutamyl-gamma-aminobutyrate hydrolase family protein [Solirubrobacterales bacterium]
MAASPPRDSDTLFTVRDRVRIGIVGDRRAASFGAWNEVELSLVWNDYVEALTRAGAAPIVFPVAECFADAPELALDVVDGLVLSGGRDLDAGSYGEDPDPANELGDPLRDRVELAIARAALERDLPTLGVCRGMQILNVVLGGGIEQHLADPERTHRGDPGTFVGHGVEAVSGTRLAAILGPGRSEVRSHHHQGVEPLAGPLRIAARSPDGVVEAAEDPARSFCVAVLWHPEEDLDGGGLDIYEALVAAARSHREAEVAA